MLSRLPTRVQLWAVVALLAAASTVQAEFDALGLVQAARIQSLHPVRYDGTYQAIDYPAGDVPADRGVCTDVIIRAYRAQGIDLQRLVHEDMRAAFAAYPDHWGLRAPDSNIDHRRVPNLQRFFERQGSALAPPDDASASDFLAGDLVTWMLPGNLPHIGVVSDRRDATDSHPLIIHNIGAGVVEDDILFRFKITGHYRFAPGSSVGGPTEP
jgi:hypothetical protein